MKHPAKRVIDGLNRIADDFARALVAETPPELHDVTIAGFLYTLALRNFHDERRRFEASQESLWAAYETYENAKRGIDEWGAIVLTRAREFERQRHAMRRRAEAAERT